MVEKFAQIQSDEVLALVTRGGNVESNHRGHMVELGVDRQINFARGNVNQLVFPRSSIKAVQASAMVKFGLQLEPRLLALVSASHSGSPAHLDGVEEILALAGLTLSSLQNAVDRPLGEAERRAWGEKEPTSLAQNCSGKHAGMILTCVINNWSKHDYLSSGHPLQVAIRQELEVLSEEIISVTSIDGCGAPLFLLSLLGLARAIQNLTISNQPSHLEVVRACRAHPEMVAGEGRSTTRIMRQYSGLFLKEGAEGVGVGSLPDGRSFAFKISDGSARAYPTLVLAALRQFGVLGVSTEQEIAPIYGGNEVVGAITANF